MGDEFCPRCGQKRLGAFRYCLGCGFDFDEPPPPIEPDPERPSSDAPTQATWVAPPVRSDTLWGAPSSPSPTSGDGSKRPSARRRWPRYAAVGVVAFLALGAIGNAMAPDDDRLSGTVDTTPTPTLMSMAPPSAAATPTAAFGPSGTTEVATVTRITDGDTIRVRIDGADVPVRYIGIDTPEPDDPDPTQRALADAATAANAALVEGRDVILERDLSDTDQFDRLLRDVWVDGPDGALVHVGLELVRTGFAKVTTYPPDVRYVEELLAAQEEAEAAETGMWAPSATPAPTATPVEVADDSPVFVGTDESARFEGEAGVYTWSSLIVDGDRLTVRWDVRAASADCRVRWTLEPTGSERIRRTVNADSGARVRDNGRYEADFTDASFAVTSSCPTWLITMRTSKSASDANCDDSYIGVCIPPYPPDLDCGDIPYTNIEVRGSDPHGFDGNGDGVGCES